MVERVTLEINLDGGQATVSTINEVIAALEALGVGANETTGQTQEFNSELNAIADIAANIGGSINEAQELVNRLGLSAQDTLRAVRTLRASQAAGEDEDIANTRLESLGLDEAQISTLRDGIGELTQDTFDWVQSIGLVSFAFNNVLQSLQILAAQGSAAYDALIGQNERLQQEILSTQASLAATTDIFENGDLVGDPTQAILALEEPIRNAIENIRRDSLELVGVTSSELIPLFQILATNTNAIANQSAEIPDPIEAATRLTIDFAATLGTLNVPLFQARQEINSILQGTIDQNSTIAKSLNLTNDQVRQYREQGRLVDEISRRLQPFVAGNALAAQSVSGITSNLQEVFEIITREAGEPLFDDLVAQLQDLFDFVDQNQEQISQDVTAAVDVLRQLILTLVGGIRNIIEQLQPAIEVVITLLREIGGEAGQAAVILLDTLLQSITAILQALNPLFVLLNQVLQVLNDTGLTELVVQAGLVAAALAAIGPIIQASLIVPLTTLATTITTTTIPAIGALIVANGGLLASLGALATAAAPVAVALGAIATAFIALRSLAIGSVNDAIDTYSDSVRLAGDEAFNYAQQLRELNQELEANGSLTEEQQRRQQGLISISEQLLAQNESQIQDLRGVRTETDAQARSVQQLIRQLEISNSALARQAGLQQDSENGVRVQSRALSELGNAYDQLTDKITGGLESINRAQGDINVITRQAQETISQTQQLAEAGVISSEQAIADLIQIANNTSLTADVQLSAQAQIFSTLQRDVQRSNETIRQLENERLIELNRLAQERLITEQEFNARSRELTVIRIQEELAAEENRLRELESLGLDPRAEIEQRRQILQRTTELQLQLIQAEREERQALNQELADNLNRRVAAETRANNLVISGLQEQQTEIQAINSDLQERIRAEQAIERGIQAQTQLINAQAEVSRAQSNLATTEVDIRIREINRIQEIIQRLSSGEVETNRERRELAQELNRLGSSQFTNQRQLQRELRDLENERIDIAQRAQIEEERRARELLELEIERTEATNRRAEIEARIAENQAASALAQAQQDELRAQGAVSQTEADLVVAQDLRDPEQIAQAEEALRLAQEEAGRAAQRTQLAAQELGFAQENVQIAQNQSALENEINGLRREALGITQQAAQAQRDAEDRARGQADQLTRAANEAVRLSTALNNVTTPDDLIRFGLVEIGQRFKGGPMEAGTPYVVGEDPSTGAILPSSEIVVPGTDSYAIAASKAQEFIRAGTEIRETREFTTTSTITQPITSSNQNIVDAIQSMRQDLQALESGTNIEGGINFYNQLMNRGDKKEAMQFAIRLMDDLGRTIGN